MIRSTIGSETFCGNSNELLSVIIFKVLRVESQMTWQEEFEKSRKRLSALK